MELYIIRHGQSYNNALMEDQHLRVQDPDLTKIGEIQAQMTADFLASATDLEQMVRHPADSPVRGDPHLHGITHLYCSAMRRAMQTAKPIGEALNITPEIWIDIHEHGGIFLEKEGVIRGYGGMTRSAIEKEFAGYVIPDAITEAGWWNPDFGEEDIEGCRARAMRVAKSLKERAKHPKTKNDHVAIIVHGTFIDCLLKSFLNTLPGEHYFHWHYNTGITRLDLLEDGRVIVRYINRVTHLTPEVVT